MQGMKPGAILPGDLSEGSGVEGRSEKNREQAPVPSVDGRESGAEIPADPPRRKTDFRGSGRLKFNESSDADIFDSTRP